MYNCIHKRRKLEIFVVFSINLPQNDIARVWISVVIGNIPNSQKIICEGVDFCNLDMYFKYFN